MTVKQIVAKVIYLNNLRNKGALQGSEYHETVFDDGVWRIDLELWVMSGQVRWWILREDKYESVQSSLFTMYRMPDTNELRYAADFPIKKSIVNKMLSIYKLLEKNGIELQRFPIV